MMISKEKAMNTYYSETLKRRVTIPEDKEMAMFYMTRYRVNEDARWEACRATTLRGAKAEATRLYGHGYNDEIIRISAGDDVTERRQILCERSQTCRNWHDV